MKKYLIIFSAIAMSLSIISCDNADKPKDSVKAADDINEENPAVKEDDSEFMAEVASSGMMEVQLGNLAMERSSNQAVKDFAALMVKDHEMANNQLKSLAESKSIVLPSTLSDKHQKRVDDLMDEPAEDFDKKYMNMMEEDHKDAIDKFEDASKNANDPDVRTFATNTLPTLHAHHQRCEAIKDGMK